MKKRILLLLNFCTLLFLSVGASASGNIMPAWNNQSSFFVMTCSDNVVNVMRSCPDELLLNTSFFTDLKQFKNECNISSGSFYWEGVIWNYYNGKEKAYFRVTCSVSDKKIYNINAKFEDTLVYNCNLTNEANPSSTVDVEIDLNDYFNETDGTFYYSNTAHIEFADNAVYDGGCQDIDAENLAFGCMIGAYYRYNTVYENKDLYFVTNIDSPLTENQILSSITVTDATEGNISGNARILNKNYNLDSNNKIEAGTYDIKIVASDTAGNITIQNAYVKVCDITAPIISVTNKEVVYNEKFEDISSLYSVTDNSGSYEITSIDDQYSDTYNTVGNHTITITARDASDNISTNVININVIDKTAPKLTVKNVTATTSSPISSIDDLYQYVTCVDDIDSNPTVSITPKEGNNYFSDTTKTGSYEFNVTVTDAYDNTISDVLTLTINDSDYPEITADQYVISVTKGQELTKDEIANLLLQSGQISSLNNISLTSTYFDSPNVEGDYDLIVSTPDGVFMSVISVKEASSNNQAETENKNDTIIDTIDYTIPTVEATTKDNSTIYIIACVVGIILITSLGVVIYKRKH